MLIVVGCNSQIVSLSAKDLQSRDSRRGALQIAEPGTGIFLSMAFFFLVIVYR